LTLVKRDDETEAQAIARAVVSPDIRAATTLESFASNDFGEIDINALTADLVAKCKTVAEDNDLRQVEGMLVSQATTLEAIFYSLARRATANLGDNNSRWFEMYLRTALKAQSQCRTTLETLALIKIPKSVAFVRQANIANGPQQVNNRLSRTRDKLKSKKSPNKLLEQTHGNTLDTPPAATAKPEDSAMATLDAIDGTENGARQSDRGPKRLQGRPHAREDTRAAPRTEASGGRKG
jgi:hypothetical protein